MSVKKKERWLDCYRVGREAAKLLPTFSTQEEIRRHFKMRNKQQAHHESLVALGKLILRVRESMRQTRRVNGLD